MMLDIKKKFYNVVWDMGNPKYFALLNINCLFKQLAAKLITNHMHDATFSKKFNVVWDMEKQNVSYFLTSSPYCLLKNC